MCTLLLMKTTDTKRYIYIFAKNFESFHNFFKRSDFYYIYSLFANVFFCDFYGFLLAILLEGIFLITVLYVWFLYTFRNMNNILNIYMCLQINSANSVPRVASHINIFINVELIRSVIDFSFIKIN